MASNSSHKIEAQSYNTIGSLKILLYVQEVEVHFIGDPEVTANLYCNFAYPYWEGCEICSIYLRQLLGYPVVGYHIKWVTTSLTYSIIYYMSKK